MNITAFEDTLYTWASGSVNVPVIFMYPNVTRPTSLYVGLNVSFIIDRGREDLAYANAAEDNTVITRSTPKIVTVDVNVFYAGALGIANTLVESLKNQKTTDLFNQNRIGFIKTSSVQKRPIEINKSWEERAHFDIDLFTRSEYNETVEQVKRVSLSGLGTDLSIN